MRPCPTLPHTGLHMRARCWNAHSLRSSGDVIHSINGTTVTEHQLAVKMINAASGSELCIEYSPAELVAHKLKEKQVVYEKPYAARALDFVAVALLL